MIKRALRLETEIRRYCRQ
jgi:hypothetical protein